MTVIALPAQLEAYKQRLHAACEASIANHQKNTSIEAVVRETAGLIDVILRDVWTLYFEDQNALSLVAVGGYGRSELNIHSDIDLLILHEFDDSVDQALEESGVDAFIQFLWDIGLEVGISVRSLEDCLSLANDDITIMTTLLESRWLAGNETMYRQFDEQIRLHSSWTNQSFFTAKFKEQIKRHERFDDTTYKLEPNIKKSPGGLRDIQTISWVANKIYGTSDPDSLMAMGLMTEDELCLFKESRNTLWALRNDLHALRGRAEDRLLFSHQQDIAAARGYKDEPGLMAIEQLMRQYYRAARDIRRLNDLILQLIDESLHTDQSVERIQLETDFYIENGYLGISDSALFSRNPTQILHVFELYQLHHSSLKGLSANCARAIRETESLINAAFRNKTEHKAIFLGLFKHENGLTHTLRKMHQYGILGAFLPIFGEIEGQMQHDLFHAYTVDAHTLMVIRNLRRTVLDRFASELPEITKLMQRTKKRYRLYLAALFHDIAKGRGGNHDTLGAAEATAFGEQFGLNKKDTELISWLVLSHLQMSKVSQREDLSNPEVIQRFAEMVGTQERLDALYLLTVADIRGTSSTTWTAWKGHLLSQLYHASSRVFSQQENIETDVASLIQDKQIKTLALLDTPIEQRRLDQYWEMLDEDYFRMYTPESIAWHATAICHASALDLPVVEARYLSDFEAEQYLIYTADSDVLLSTLAGVFDRFSQNIVQARIHAANPGFTVLIFTVTSAQTIIEEADLEEHTATMRHALLQAREHKAPIKKMLPQRLKQFTVEPQIKFTADNEGKQTLLSITALDQPGLIHLIATAMAKCQIRLISAHIATAGEKALDRFVVCQPNRNKALTERQQNCLYDSLMQALASGE